MQKAMQSKQAIRTHPKPRKKWEEHITGGQILLEKGKRRDRAQASFLELPLGLSLKERIRF